MNYIKSTITEQESMAWTKEKMIHVRKAVKIFKAQMESVLNDPIVWDCWSMCSLRDLIRNMEDFIDDTDDVEDGESDLDE